MLALLLHLAFAEEPSPPSIRSDVVVSAGVTREGFPSSGWTTPSGSRWSLGGAVAWTRRWTWLEVGGAWSASSPAAQAHEGSAGEVDFIQPVFDLRAQGGVDVGTPVFRTLEARHPTTVLALVGARAVFGRAADATTDAEILGVPGLHVGLSGLTTWSSRLRSRLDLGSTLIVLPAPDFGTGPGRDFGWVALHGVRVGGAWSARAAGRGSRSTE